ncbi:MAG: hypothetical protein JNK87_36050 [Bryobacterales bacterium]|nr:hypothetical protein [Bryobacterales bacterium]
MSLFVGTRRYSVYGYDFILSGNCPAAIDGLHEDFTFFSGESANTQPVTLVLDRETPRYQDLPECDASVYTPRNVVYRDGDRRILDFGGRGLGIYEPLQRRFTMTSESPDLLYEAGYLFLLSQIGQRADQQGMSRVHAMAIAYRGRAILAMLPMGGGKSTLAAALLKHPELRILSDDSPFLDRNGDVHAFPLRLGLLEGREKDIPQAHLRRVERMEFGPKYLVNHSYFAERVDPFAEPGMLLIGRRTLSPRGRLERASYSQAMQAMVPHSIVGLGLFQGLEYILERSTGELIGKLGVAFSRARNAHRLIRRSHNYVLHMGRDPEQNAQLILETAESLFGNA